MFAFFKARRLATLKYFTLQDYENAFYEAMLHMDGTQLTPFNMYLVTNDDGLLTLSNPSIFGWLSATSLGDVMAGEEGSFCGYPIRYGTIMDGEGAIMLRSTFSLWWRGIVQDWKDGVFPLSRLFQRRYTAQLAEPPAN